MCAQSNRLGVKDEVSPPKARVFLVRKGIQKNHQLGGKIFCIIFIIILPYVLNVSHSNLGGVIVKLDKQ